MPIALGFVFFFLEELLSWLQALPTLKKLVFPEHVSGKNCSQVDLDDTVQALAKDEIGPRGGGPPQNRKMLGF